MFAVRVRDGNDGRASPRGTVIAHDARENGRSVPSCNAKSDRRGRGEYTHRRLKEARHQISEEHNRHLNGVSALSPPNFAIFLNDRSSHTGGDRGKAECGASAEGWRERPALVLLRSSVERVCGADVALMTARRQRPLSPRGPC